MPWRSLVVAVVVALGGCSPAAPPVGTTRDAAGPSTDAAAAPNFSVETFDGETFALAEQRGMPVVINFWESW